MTKQIQNILLATDGSESAKNAAAFANSIARSVNAKITVITVHDDHLLRFYAAEPTLWPISEEAMNIEAIKAAIEEKSIETTIADTLASLENIADIEVVQRWGHIAKSICDFANERQCDLLIIGSRGLSNVRQALLGGVSADVVQHADCPVTVVR